MMEDILDADDSELSRHKCIYKIEFYTTYN